MSKLEYEQREMELKLQEWKQEGELQLEKDNEAMMLRIKNAIKAVKIYPARLIRENLKSNLNPLFTKQKDGSEDLLFGINSCYTLQLNFQNTERYTKKSIVDELNDLLDRY